MYDFYDMDIPLTSQFRKKSRSRNHCLTGTPTYKWGWVELQREIDKYWRGLYSLICHINRTNPFYQSFYSGKFFFVPKWNNFYKIIFWKIVPKLRYIYFDTMYTALQLFRVVYRNEATRIFPSRLASILYSYHYVFCF